MEIEIGTRVEVIGDARELLGKTGTVTSIEVIDFNYPNCWRPATARDFEKSLEPYTPIFIGSCPIPLELPTEIYFRVEFDIPSLLPDFNGKRRELITNDVYQADDLRLLAEAA
jgi:hypothetical protein